MFQLFFLSSTMANQHIGPNDTEIIKMNYLNRSIVRLTFLITVTYCLFITASIVVPSVLAVVAHAKWLPGFLAGIVAGYFCDTPEQRDRIYSVLYFAILMAFGWTTFSAVTIGADVTQFTGLLIAGIIVCLVGSFTTYLGVALGMYIATPNLTNEAEQESVDAEFRQLVERTDLDSDK